MKKKNILKKNHEFDYVIKKGKKMRSKNFILYFLPFNAINDYQVGLSVGKKCGNAVQRNKEKRIIRNIMSENIQVQNQHLYVIITMKSVMDCSMNEQKKELKKLFERVCNVKK